jgi:hypothetical protein
LIKLNYSGSNLLKYNWGESLSAEISFEIHLRISVELDSDTQHAFEGIKPQTCSGCGVPDNERHIDEP